MKFKLEQAYTRVWSGYNRKGGGSSVNTKNLISAQRGTDIKGDVMKAILSSEYGITTSEIVKTTGYTRRQVQGVIYKSDLIRKIGGRFGNEIFVIGDL